MNRLTTLKLRNLSDNFAVNTKYNNLSTGEDNSISQEIQKTKMKKKIFFCKKNLTFDVIVNFSDI